MEGKKVPAVNIFLVGGFLGSGKTTAISNACKLLMAEGKRVAVITNDQGNQQVDTNYMRQLNIPGAEVADGCFCCNYTSLEKNITALTATLSPESIFAESVGSCTDLVATIAKPFAIFHPEFRVVISVFADAALIYSVIKGTASFINEPVRYIYQKQLEEADVLIINKTDLLSSAELNELRQVIHESYPSGTILYQDSLNRMDIINWLDTINGYTAKRSRMSLELDYDIYGAGEAELAWLDKKINIHAVKPVAMQIALQLAALIYAKIKEAGYAIGHVKLLVDDGYQVKKISYTTSGRGKDIVEDYFPAKEVSVLINARVRTTSSLLLDLVDQAIRETGISTGSRIITESENSFQPGYPKPLHRILV
ncbi:MAG: hypothetical protein JSS70_06805 [Bacteroidetes bacterium]|nr:hypothetical protein [Bacteroidota bacterium]